MSFPAVNCVLQDKKGFIWIGTEIGLNKYDSQKFKTFYTDPADSLSLPNDAVSCLYEDQAENMWVGTQSGLAIYDRNNASFRRAKDSTLQTKKILAVTSRTADDNWVLTSRELLLIDAQFAVKQKYPLKNITSEQDLTAFSTAKSDAQGRLWISTNKGVRLFDPKIQKLTNPLADLIDATITTVDFFSAIYFDSRQNLWLGMRGNGVKYYSFAEKKWHRIDNVSSRYVNGVFEDIDKNIWICTGRNGLNLYHPKTGQVEVIKYADMPESNLTSNSISCIYGDAMGGIWLGTFNNGLLYYYQHQLKFNLYYSKGQISGISSNYITSFAPDHSGNLWIGVGEEGLLYFERKKRRFLKFQPQDIFKSNAELKENFYILSLLLSSDQRHLFIGTLTGFFDYNILTQKWLFYSHKTVNPQALQGGYINSFVQDKDELFFVTLNGMSVYNCRTRTIQNHQIPLRQMANLVQDSEFVYIGTRQDGLWLFDKKARSLSKFSSKKVSVPSRIRCVLLDRKNQLIVGTDNQGVFRFNREFTKSEVIPNASSGERLIFMGLCEDRNGGYWSTTNKGLVNITKEFKIKKIFTANDGFNPSFFTQNSILTIPNDEILVGGNAGFYSFFPADFYSSKNVNSKIRLIDFLVLNKSVVSSGTEGFKVKGDLENVKQIHLPTYQNLLTFEYTTLDFHNPSRGEYAYRLVPYDKDWNSVGNRRYATYRDLPAGTYTFQVKYLPQDGTHHPEITQIEVSIPAVWWQSKWAYLVYFILIFLLVRQFYLYRTNKRKMRQELEMQRFQSEKMEELYQFKIDFFTQITHELRTPLTLIISPLEEMIRRNASPSENNLLKIIHRNTQKLLLTVNQILDFRKIENSDMKVFAKKGNIVSFAEEILYSFLKLTEKKGIDLLFETNMEKYPYVLFDKDIMEKILVNLIANAVKFTQQGSIRLNIFEPEEVAAASHFFIEIVDTGQGIKSENLKHIFDSFFQENRDNHSVGSGLGLKIVKELTHLHRGTIEVTSALNQGTRFLLSFPKADLDLMNEEPIKPGISREVEWNEPNEPSPKEKSAASAKILIVDDEPDLLLFLEEIFENEYQVYAADSGKKALDIAKTELPDLIVSDVMMPEMSGFELCAFAKTDFLLSHIPIVLLTALNSTDHEIEGLKTGADAYIAKPFPVNLLKATVQNLLTSRQKLKQAFLNSSLSSAGEVTQNNSDKVFLEKVIAVIDAKLDQTDLEIGDISEELGMSQSTFYRKLKSLTDLAGNEFIRTVRLKRSVELMKNSDFNISEIAYRVGFSDPKYFSTCFRKFYHITPTEFIAQNRKDKSQIVL
ncbi:MAG: two-component regulator propeller domain-containing protein [Spirosomataceae bacterium]